MNRLSASEVRKRFSEAVTQAAFGGERIIIERSGKALAALIQQASIADKHSTFLFLHTGGTPALFGYQEAIERALTLKAE